MCFNSSEAAGQRNLKLGMIDHCSARSVIRGLVTLEPKINFFDWLVLMEDCDV